MVRSRPALNLSRATAKKEVGPREIIERSTAASFAGSKLTHHGFKSPTCHQTGNRLVRQSVQRSRPWEKAIPYCQESNP